MPRGLPPEAVELAAELAAWAAAGGERFAPGEPLCLFRGSDPLVLEVLQIYLARSRAAGRPERFCRSVAAQLDIVASWQAANAARVPAPGDDPLKPAGG